VEIPEQLYGSVKKYSRQISRYSRKIAPDFQLPIIHTFRTSIKKLKALFHWQDIKKDNWPDDFKKCYHISGEIRDAQLFLQKIVQEKLEVPGLAIWLATRIGHLQQEWENEYKKNTWKDWSSHVSNHQFSFWEDPPGEFYEQKLQTIRYLITANPVMDEDIHQGRKALKDIQYVAAWYKEKQPEDDSLEVPDESLKLISDIAGEYIDLVKQIEILNFYLQKEEEDEEKNAATVLINSLETQKQIKQQQLLNAIRSFDFFENCPE
jgi:CHAD domain-containing protein